MSQVLKVLSFDMTGAKSSLMSEGSGLEGCVSTTGSTSASNCDGVPTAANQQESPCTKLCDLLWTYRSTLLRLRAYDPTAADYSAADGKRMRICLSRRCGWAHRAMETL